MLVDKTLNGHVIGAVTRIFDFTGGYDKTQYLICWRMSDLLKDILPYHDEDTTRIFKAGHAAAYRLCSSLIVWFGVGRHLELVVFVFIGCWMKTGVQMGLHLYR